MKDDWALCVGIANYGEGSRLAPLPGAVNDARAMRAWLIDRQGGDVPETQAELILSPPPAPGEDPAPTAEAIEFFLRSLYRRATESARRGDGFRCGRRLWLFYSGHGIGFPEGPETGLLTADALLPNELPHVAGHAWAETFRVSAAFDEVVLFMDCCRTEASRVAIRRPPLRPDLADPEGRMMAAYAVAPSKAAFEIDVAGVPRGRFSSSLEALLRAPPETPLKARAFLDLLYQRCPEVDAYPPRSPRDDFELFGAAALPTPAAPSLLVAHGESTGELARKLAEAFSSPSVVRWAEAIPAMPPKELESIRDLVVTRAVDLLALRALVSRVAPRRTVVVGESDPGVTALPNVSFVARPAPDKTDVAQCAADIEAALAGLRGTLVVEAEEELAFVRVWDERGHSVGQGHARVRLADLPVGRYQARVSLGMRHADAEVDVRAGEECRLELSAVPFALPAGRELVQRQPGPTGPARRTAVRVPLPDGDVMLSLPEVEGWTTQVFSTEPGPSGLSVRMIPPGHPPSAPMPTDSLREGLRLALSAPHWAAPGPTADQVDADPIAALLAAALCLRNDVPNQEHVRAAAKVLGDDDVDVRLLRSGTTVSDPPLLALPWRHRLQAGSLKVQEKSVSDLIVDRHCLAAPWLAWSPDQPTAPGSWLAQVANAAWPGWDVAPDLEFAAEDLGASAIHLGSPSASVRSRSYKSPPVDRLVQHRRVAFVGASNDQLPAALAVAFVARNRERWDRVEVWSLSDAQLALMKSNGRTGARLLAARDRAEKQLGQLLPLVAREWSARRYQGMTLGDGVHFASLWDWDAQGGWVHLSALDHGQDVRTTPAEEVVWMSDDPPARFTEAVGAYETLRADLRHQ